MIRRDRLTEASVLAGLIAAYHLVARPLLLRWGATDDEVREVFPGEDVVPGGVRGATMATTICAPPAAVWPWLVQMGCDRAGWYSVDRFDNGGRPSADRIHPEWQQLALGDRLASTPSGRAWFEVAALETGSVLVLRASLDLRGRPFGPGSPPPRHYIDSTWGFKLRELPGDRTRLVVSGYSAGRPKALLRVVDRVFWEPAHWIMQRSQFANLKRRAEAGRTAQDPSRTPVPSA